METGDGMDIKENDTDMIIVAAIHAYDFQRILGSEGLKHSAGATTIC